ncbi:MAG: PEP-CTERM sorting domain-containing protein, partial [Vicinamibacterales bacterium]
MLSRSIRLSLAVLVCQMLMPAPARAAIINWQYAGTVSANPSHYGGVNVGDAVTMTVAVDMAAIDVYGSGSGASLQACGLYTVPSVTVSFGGLFYQSWSPTMTVNTPAAAGNCGYGPSQDGYVLAGAGSNSTPGSLPWRLYAEIRDVPISDSLPMSAPLGSGVFLDLAYGFMPPSGALFSLTANLTSASVRTLPAAVPEPATLSLAIIGLASFGARQLARRRATR